MKITKRNGKSEELSVDKINKIVTWACEGLDANPSDIILNAKIRFKDGMKTTKIHELLVESAKDLISARKPDYQYVASKLFNFYIRKQIFGVFLDEDMPSVYDVVVTNTELGLYDENLIKKYSEEEWGQIDKLIKHSEDSKSTIASYEKMYNSYLVRNRDTKYVYETPQYAFILIAASIFDTIKEIEGYYNLLKGGWLNQPTPIMAGVRTPTKQFASCFLKDQEVFTSDGVNSISEVLEGDLVLTHRGNYKKVLATNVKKYSGNITKLDTTLGFKGKLKPTEEHLFFSIKKENRKTGKTEWVEAKNLKVGDYIIAPYNKKVTYVDTINLLNYVGNDDKMFVLNEGDGMVYKPSSDKKGRSGLYDNKVNPIKNIVKLNENLYRLLGYYLAEGSMHGRCVNFTFHKKEREYIEDVKYIIKEEFGLIANDYQSNFDNSTKVTVYNRLFAMFINKVCGVNSKHKRIANFITNSEFSKQAELLKGVIRGDGFSHKQGVGIALTNKNLIIQLGDMLLRNKVSISYTTIKPKKTSKEAYRIDIAKTGNEDFIKFLGKDLNKIDESKTNVSKNGIWVNGDYFTRVKNIGTEIMKNIDVYDLQVEDDKSFTVNGVGAHNCTLIDIDDDLDSIYSSAHAIGRFVSRKAGIGLNMGRIRSLGSPIRGGEAVHTGIIPFLKFEEAATKSCSQGGIREGSATVHFQIWNSEIESILVLKNNKGTDDNRVRRLDYSIQLSKLFINRMLKGEKITLFSTSECPGLYDAWGTDSFDDLYLKYEREHLEEFGKDSDKIVEGRDLLQSLVSERINTGRIYIQMIDNVNNNNAFNDKITMSNLCMSPDTLLDVKIETELDDIKLIKELNKEDDRYTGKLTIEALDSLFKHLKQHGSGKIEVKSKNLETDEVEYNVVTASAMTNPDAELYEIEDTESGITIKCTADHKIYTKNRGYVLAKELKEEDILDIN